MMKGSLPSSYLEEAVTSGPRCAHVGALRLMTDGTTLTREDGADTGFLKGGTRWLVK